MKSKITFLCIVCCYLFSFKQYANYNGFLKGGGDAWGYYAYLPASFIYKDIDNLQRTIQQRAVYNPNSVTKTRDGQLQIEEAHAYQKHVIIKYTYGVALLSAPFFFIAHSFCTLTHLYPADGYAAPYNWFIGLSTLFYSLLGLWILKRLLSNYFSDTITAVTLIIIALGTNLYFFSVLNVGMSHPYLFALYALCIYATDKFYATKQLKYAILLGCSTGMITLIRPNEIIILLFPLLWNIFSFQDIKNRFQFFKEYCWHYVIMMTVFLAVLLPQLIYWKLLSGKLLFYSYTKEGFDFLHPHLIGGLFGFSNGWLVYTPAMLFSLVGLFYLPRYFRKSALATYIFLPLYLYIIYSWWCWQYVNGFGSRPMIETYALLAFPLASFLTYMEDKKIKKILSGIMLCCFLLLNLFQTWQFNKGLIWTEDANLAFYTSIFLKTKCDAKTLTAYDCGEIQPDLNNLKQVKLLQIQTFEDSLNIDYTHTIVHEGKYAYQPNSGTTPVITIPAANSGIQSGDYIKASCWVYCSEPEYNHYRQAVLAMEFKHEGRQIRWRGIRLQNKIGNVTHSIWHAGNTHQWQYVSFYVRVPHRFKTKDDTLSVLVWNPGNTAVCIDDIRIEWWKEKSKATW